MPGALPENTPRPELTALERSLRGLAPDPGGLDRDTLLFRAGQAAAPRRWLWPTATAVSTAAAIVLGGLLALRPSPGERVVYVPVPVPVPAPAAVPETPPDTGSASEDHAPPEELPPHRRLLEHLLRWGLDGLGQPPPPPAPRPRPNAHPYLSSGELLP
jgi:hypothetical protein